jgi:hypothetical protein
VFVSDFVFSGDVTAVDRGFTARLEHKVGSFPTFERKQRTNARVNDEMVATIIASLRDVGLEAQPGNEDGLTLRDDVLLITGRVRAVDEANAANNKQLGFGAGRGGVVADMTVWHFSSGGKRQLLTFTAEAQKLAALNPKQAKARGAAIDAALAAQGTPAVKLSADTEAQARRFGRAIGDKVAGFAREQGWLAKPGEAAEPALASSSAAPAAAPAKNPKPPRDKTAVTLPKPRPGAKPASEPAPAPEPEQKPEQQPAPEPEQKLEPWPEAKPDKPS